MALSSDKGMLEKVAHDGGRRESADGRDGRYIVGIAHTYIGLGDRVSESYLLTGISMYYTVIASKTTSGSQDRETLFSNWIPAASK